MQIHTEIRTVRDDVRSWDSRNGTMYSVEGTFDDGAGWSVSFKTPERAREQQTVLKGLIGQQHPFDVEDTGREYRGAKQYKLKEYPGKPQPQGAGGFGGRGGGGYQPRYRDTEQGAKEERASIERQVALKEAVNFLKDSTARDPREVLVCADGFYGWLVGPQRATPASPAQVQAQSRQANSLVDQANKLFNYEEPPKEPPPAAGGYKTVACPNCGKTEHVRKSKLDGTPPWYCFKKIGGCGHQWGDVQPLTNDAPKEERSVAVVASEEVDKCVKAKDLTRLMKVGEHIVNAHHDGRITDGELQELDIEVTTGKRAIESGQNYDSWYRTKLAEVQRGSQELSPEMSDLAGRF